MGDRVREVIEAMVERLYDLESCDPCLYLIQKEQLRALYELYRSDEELTLEKVKQLLEEGGLDG
jgi:hypothetical protein